MDLKLNIPILLFFLIFYQMGCVTSRENINLTYTVKVDAKTKGTPKGTQISIIDREKFDEDIDLASRFAKVQLALEKSGYRIVPSSRSSNFKVKIEFERLNSASRESILGAFPHRHSLIVKGFKNKKVVWQTKVFSYHEEEKIDRILPYLLAAGVPYFGKSTEGVKKIDIKGTDPLVTEFREYQSPQ